MFSCEYYEVSKNTYFEEHLRTAASEVTLGSDCLGLFFWTAAFKIVLTWKCYKYTSRFLTRALTQFGAYALFNFNPKTFFWTLILRVYH